MPSFPPTSFQDAHVVIFGGSAGIGLATAAAVKARGATVMLVGRTAERLAAASSQLGGVGTAVADIAQRAEVEAVFEGLSRVDHLVITAGGLQGGLLAETDPDCLFKAVSERIAGPLYAIKAALPLLPSSGSIVLMGGLYSDRPPGNGAATTAAAVRGVEALARALALELKPIRVNVIAPGVIDTALYDLFGADARAEIFDRTAKASPVGRVGTPEEVADAIAFLLGAGYVNGEVLHIDGGSRFV